MCRVPTSYEASPKSVNDQFPKDRHSVPGQTDLLGGRDSLHSSHGADLNRLTATCDRFVCRLLMRWGRLRFTTCHDPSGLLRFSVPLQHETIKKRYQAGNAGIICSEETPGKRRINGRNCEIDSHQRAFTSAWDQDHDGR